VLHMPPVVPVGSLSTMVAFHASLLPVFCTLRVNCPSWPGFIVAGPPLVITRPGAAMVSGGDETPCCPAGIGGKPLKVSSPLAFFSAMRRRPPRPTHFPYTTRPEHHRLLRGPRR